MAFVQCKGELPEPYFKRLFEVEESRYRQIRNITATAATAWALDPAPFGLEPWEACGSEADEAAFTAACRRLKGHARSTLTLRQVEAVRREREAASEAEDPAAEEQRGRLELEAELVKAAGEGAGRLPFPEAGEGARPLKQAANPEPAAEAPAVDEQTEALLVLRPNHRKMLRAIMEHGGKPTATDLDAMMPRPDWWQSRATLQRLRPELREAEYIRDAKENRVGMQLTEAGRKVARADAQR